MITIGRLLSPAVKAEAIFEEAHAARLLERVPRVLPITTRDYPTPAARPAYSVLEARRLCEDFGIQPPQWRDGLHAVIAELAAR